MTHKLKSHVARSSQICRYDTFSESEEKGEQVQSCTKRDRNSRPMWPRHAIVALLETKRPTTNWHKQPRSCRMNCLRTRACKDAGRMQVHYFQVKDCLQRSSAILSTSRSEETLLFLVSFKGGGWFQGFLLFQWFQPTRTPSLLVELRSNGSVGQKVPQGWGVMT